MTNNLDVCDEETFKQIFKENFKPLQNLFYYKYGDLEKAKDLMQESFIKLWNNCKKVTYEKSKGYLFMLARNAFLNDVKRQDMINRHHKGIDKNLLYIESPDYVLEEKEFLNKINSAISLLPDKQREVFLLNRMDEKTYKEISEMLDISIKTVEKWMHDALVVLRKKIGNV
ncbi:RNA polymerase sigma factor [Abyssalbus ytuae]|uniref:Sigma-70 family RNA polymerase sigma factor n=1 Tax=Abyssalbus ytuae TaxID=2926907 RepID=A0A9E6ZZE5_9FLAO|nr:sigma-70 family RNA polymerase sigma factor [Abyssalbus ytuae]UOB16671.1 sigma-70 family RNA polymerase sigma factor [Abyssalbus ytuae]